MNSAHEDLLRQALQSAETERAFGFEAVPLPSRTSAPATIKKATVSGSKKERIAALYAEYKNCALCPLAATRTQIVFGAGDPEARLMFVGEAPGFDEDKQGEPFVGAAGQLLTKIIQAMKLSREEVYIANCLKCRPPQNRNPLPDEIAACSPILRQQIDIIRLEIVVALGKFAAQTLLATEDPISRLRGRFFDFRGARLMPTFHPAYLLRNPDDKRLVWQDMQLVMKELGIG